MLEVLKLSFIHIVLPEKKYSTNKSTKSLNQEVDIVIVMLVHFSIMNTYQQYIQKALMHQRYNNTTTKQQ